jgi:hypothetical protein
MRQGSSRYPWSIKDLSSFAKAVKTIVQSVCQFGSGEYNAEEINNVLATRTGRDELEDSVKIPHRRSPIKRWATTS